MTVIESEDCIVAVGNSYSSLAGFPGGKGGVGTSEFVIAKFNKTDFSLIRINNFGGSGTDQFHSVIEDNDSYVAIGRSNSNLEGFNGGSDTEGNYDFVIVRFNKTNLSLMSINNFGGSNIDYLYSLIKSGDYYIAVGQSLSHLNLLPGGGLNSGNSDFVIAKFNRNNLSLVSVNNFGNSGSDMLSSVIESGDYYITAGCSYSDLSEFPGGSNVNSSGFLDFVIAKFNKTDISLSRINNLGGSSVDNLNSITESDNYYIASGNTWSDLSGLPKGDINTGGLDFVLSRFNKTDISLKDIKNFGGSSFDGFNSVIHSGDDLIAVGYSGSDLSGFTGGEPPAAGYDFIISKFGEGFLLPYYNNFSLSITTNFSNISDLANVTNLTLANLNGKIKFSESYGINADGEDYDTNVKIEDSMIFVNSTALHSTFNSSAILTFNNVDCSKPYVFYSETASTFAAILVENQRCYDPLCTDIQCSEGTLIVNVSHFTGFAAGANANLTIYAEAGVKYENESIEFIAEYVNSTDGTPISGTCNITFNNGVSWDSMDFDSNDYNYSRSFLTSGLKSYNVSCAGVGYVSLEVNDTKYVSAAGAAVPEFSLLTFGLGLIAILAGLLIIRKRNI